MKAPDGDGARDARIRACIATLSDGELMHLLATSPKAATAARKRRRTDWVKVGGCVTALLYCAVWWAAVGYLGWLAWQAVTR